MTRAIELAGSPGVPHGPNPRVGCVILDPSGQTIGEGFHEGAGSAHAEVNALEAAGAAARGATLVVTLEPCNHQGRTPPCSAAVIAAGISRVVYAQSDPNAIAQGGTAVLKDSGIEVVGGVLADEAELLNGPWSIACRRGLPFVTLKLAATLDGRIAAADGSSRWITGPSVARDVHELRNHVDAVLVGTGTVLDDDPQLTVRNVDLVGNQPIRVVMGEREVPSTAQVLDDAAPTLRLKTRDIDVALKNLFAESVRHVLVEGGGTIAAAFIRAGRVDQIRWYVAPAVLGAGISAIADMGISNIGGAVRWHTEAVHQIGDDARIDMRAQPATDTTEGGR